MGIMVLQLDLKNEFNCVDRGSAFREVQTHFPEFLNWVLTCYGGEAELLFGETVIQSQTGFHQDDPLASLLFSLTLQPVVNILKLQTPDLVVNEWYLDDGVVVGSREDLQKVVDIMLSHGPERGLFLSSSKSSICPHSSLPAEIGLNYTCESTCSVL